MMTVSIEGNEPVQVRWDGLGRFVHASGIGRHQEGYPTSAVVERFIDDKVLADFSGSSLVLLTKTSRSGPPERGYLMPRSYGKLCPCLEISIVGERNAANPLSIVHGEITCTAGVLMNAAALGLTTRVTIKQTARQDQIQSLFQSVPWHAVYRAAIIEAQARQQTGFYPIEKCSPDGSQKMRLAMILHADFWRRIDATQEVMRNDLIVLGIKVGGASSVAKIFGRLEVDISGA